ncbi:MAG: hypothetical protein ACKO4T_07265 [Planctomycetaceae bacterium]
MCGDSSREVAAVAVGSSESSPFDGDRQDDAGTLIEEQGEDEIEQHESRIEHGWVAATPSMAADAPGRFSSSIHLNSSSSRTNSTALSRGPPPGV